MITANAARLKAAQSLLIRFIQIGRSNGKADAQRAAALQRSPAGWPVKRAELARQVQDRLKGILTDQLETSYCGPAAFLCCLIHDRPDIYVTYALSLWEHGRFIFGNREATLNVDRRGKRTPVAG